MNIQKAAAGGAPPPPPPPPPLPPVEIKANTPPPAPKPPAVVTPQNPAGAFLVQLVIFNGAPFKDHWAYWIPSKTDDSVGIQIHATGDVNNGFKFEIKRNHDFDATTTLPAATVSLQWIEASEAEQKAMFDNGNSSVDGTPISRFETCLYQVKVPGKSLNASGDRARAGTKVIQRDCPTWIVESADELAARGIFSKEVAAYLRATEQ
ncbi:hypothetical protein BN1723_010165 [Verticillium longisporum]|uniref:Uncharacterized protein n=1 Tax=Verticillium longisporum TaxID=100787 RepID=A0A0G4KW47_VERLO|nr:hypothetical protein HYQ44_004544 [Verticillium longisporum]CRK13896.1 hypothetical protein BN1723_010165 [Verticillium longisporum]CRK29855.1 hypothetical protein BN1708_015699 [Verticillium longisporum]